MMTKEKLRDDTRPGGVFIFYSFLVSENDARIKARDFLADKRLPNNTDIWCNEEEVCYDC